MTQVKLPDGTWVNPNHVTCIEFGGGRTLVWVIKDGGYHTGALCFDGDQREKIAAILNGKS